MFFHNAGSIFLVKFLVNYHTLYIYFLLLSIIVITNNTKECYKLNKKLSLFGIYLTFNQNNHHNLYYKNLFKIIILNLVVYNII